MTNKEFFKAFGISREGDFLIYKGLRAKITKHGIWRTLRENWGIRPFAPGQPVRDFRTQENGRIVGIRDEKYIVDFGKEVLVNPDNLRPGWSINLYTADNVKKVGVFLVSSMGEKTMRFGRISVKMDILKEIMFDPPGKIFLHQHKEEPAYLMRDEFLYWLENHNIKL